MPRYKYQEGVIDPISIISLGFLAISLIIASITVTKNKGLKFFQKAQVVSCSNFVQEDCLDTPGCSWIPTSSQSTLRNCTMADCEAGKTGCNYTPAQTITKGACTGEGECFIYRDENGCEGSGLGCTWTLTTTTTPAKCSGQYTYVVTTPGHCEGEIIPQTTPTPRVTMTALPSPNCGGENEECCGGPPPYGTCNSGYYCSNMDNGVCLKTNCQPGNRICEDNMIKVCKEDGSNYQTLFNCELGCSNETKECLVCNQGEFQCDGQTLKKCNLPQTGWDTLQTCPSDTVCNVNMGMCTTDSGTNCVDPCTQDADCSLNQYCFVPATGCPVCKDKGTVCTPNSLKCSSDGKYIQRCSITGENWVSELCPNGCQSTTTNNQMVASCKVMPSPTPTAQSSTAACSTNNGQCLYQSSCGQLGTIPGSCPSPAICCGKNILEDQCNLGDFYCDINDVSQTTFYTCRSDRTGYVKGTCPVNEYCRSDTKSCSTLKPIQQTDNKCVADGNQCIYSSTCGTLQTPVGYEGTCPQPAICCSKSFIVDKCDPGKTECIDQDTVKICALSETGYKWTSKDCAENYVCYGSTCNPKKVLGKECNDDFECISGNCYSSTMLLGGNPLDTKKTCRAYPIVEMDQATLLANQGTIIAGTIFLSFVPGVGPVLQLAGATYNTVGAYYSCTQKNDAAKDPRVSANLLQQLEKECNLYLAGAITSSIAGGSMAATSRLASVTAQLAASGINLADSAVNLSIADMQRQMICNTDPDSAECYMAYIYETLGLAGTMYGGINTYSSAKSYAYSQIDQAFNFGYYTNTSLTGPSLGSTILDDPLGTVIAKTNSQTIEIMNNILGQNGMHSNITLGFDSYIGEINTINSAAGRIGNDSQDEIYKFLASVHTTDTVDPMCLGPQCLSANLVPTIKDLAINPELRNLGYGSTVVSSYETAVVAQGLDTVVLKNVNRDAVEFWLSQGYIIPESELRKIQPYYMYKLLNP